MLGTSLLFIMHIIAINRKSRISLLHAQDTGYSGLAAVILAKLLGIPIIVSSHGLRYVTLSYTKGFSRRLLMPWEYWLDVFTSRHADLVISVSPKGEKFFARIGVEKPKLKLIPTGIETNSYKVREEVRQSVRNEFGVKDDVLLGFVGRLSEEKNLFTLVEAFASALKCTKKLKLILVGPGPLQKRLEMISLERNASDKIVLTGIRYDVNRILSAFDIFVLPSYTEGCSTSLQEAMAAGRAIIASDIPGIREFVRDHVEAVLVNPYEVDELKQAILLLYRNPTLRTELGRRAEEKVKLYDANIIWGRILTTYENLCLRKAHPRASERKFRHLSNLHLCFA
jgi:glycosyltransferase involved in cell wall biosynthesis